MISDMHSPERRARALSIYAFGIPIGGSLGLLIGGWMRELFGWREAFMVVAVTGLGARSWCSRRCESRRVVIGKPARERAPARIARRVPLSSEAPSFWHLAFAGALHAFYGYGAASFTPCSSSAPMAWVRAEYRRSLRASASPPAS